MDTGASDHIICSIFSFKLTLLLLIVFHQDEKIGLSCVASDLIFLMSCVP